MNDKFHAIFLKSPGQFEYNKANMVRMLGKRQNICLHVLHLLVTH